MKTKDLSQLHAEFIRLFELAKDSGVCKNAAELASYLYMSRATISGALKANENNLTEPLVKKLRQFLIRDGYLQPEVNTGSIENSPNANTGISQGITEEKHLAVVREIRTGYDHMIEEMRAQREAYMQLLLSKTDK